MLDVHRIPFIAVDSDARLVARARAAGKRVYYGDASRPDYLRRCGLETARAVVVTMDLPSANEAVVETTRSIRRDVTLVARARDAAHARALYGLGVTDAVPETIEASLQLSEAVLVDLGVPMGLVIIWRGPAEAAPPPPIVEGYPSAMSEDERQRLGLRRLPQTLAEALVALAVNVTSAAGSQSPFTRPIMV